MFFVLELSGQPVATGNLLILHGPEDLALSLMGCKQAALSPAAPVLGWYRFAGRTSQWGLLVR